MIQGIEKIGRLLAQAQSLNLECEKRIRELEEFLHEVSLPPYKDSNTDSLLQTLRTRAKYLLEKDWMSHK